MEIFYEYKTQQSKTFLIEVNYFFGIENLYLQYDVLIFMHIKNSKNF